MNYSANYQLFVWIDKSFGPVLAWTALVIEIFTSSLYSLAHISWALYLQLYSGMTFSICYCFFLRHTSYSYSSLQLMDFLLHVYLSCSSVSLSFLCIFCHFFYFFMPFFLYKWIWLATVGKHSSLTQFSQWITHECRHPVFIFFHKALQESLSVSSREFNGKWTWLQSWE